MPIITSGFCSGKFHQFYRLFIKKIVFIVVVSLSCTSCIKSRPYGIFQLSNFHPKASINSDELQKYRDGNKDTTPILQSYFDRGIVIRMPPGRYKVDGLLRLKSNSGIIGTGPEKTVIVLSSLRSGFRGEDCENVTFSNLKITDHSHKKIRGGYVFRFITSLKGKSKNIRLENIEAFDVGGSFFSATGNCTDIAIINACIFYNNRKKYIRGKDPSGEG